MRIIQDTIQVYKCGANTESSTETNVGKQMMKTDTGSKWWEKRSGTTTFHH